VVAVAASSSTSVEASYHEEIYKMTIMDALTGAHNKRLEPTTSYPSKWSSVAVSVWISASSGAVRTVRQRPTESVAMPTPRWLRVASSAGTPAGTSS